MTTFKIATQLVHSSQCTSFHQLDLWQTWLDADPNLFCPQALNFLGNNSPRTTNTDFQKTKIKKLHFRLTKSQKPPSDATSMTTDCLDCFGRHCKWQFCLSQNVVWNEYKVICKTTFLQTKHYFKLYWLDEITNNTAKKKALPFIVVNIIASALLEPVPSWLEVGESDSNCECTYTWLK